MVVKDSVLDPKIWPVKYSATKTCRTTKANGNTEGYINVKKFEDDMANNEKNNEFLAAHEDVVKRVLESQPAEEVLYDLAELFKVFGDSTRIRILYVLFESEMCVCDIAQILNMSQSAISHQLRVLKQMKLVKNRREGKTIFYSLADDHITMILSQGIEHIEED